MKRNGEEASSSTSPKARLRNQDVILTLCECYLVRGFCEPAVKNEEGSNLIENLWSAIDSKACCQLFTLHQAQPLPSGKRAGHKSIYAEMNGFYRPGSVGEALGLFCAVAEDLWNQLLQRAIRTAKDAEAPTIVGEDVIGGGNTYAWH